MLVRRRVGACNPGSTVLLQVNAVICPPSLDREEAG
jgi:hypothetical protein